MARATWDHERGADAVDSRENGCADAGWLGVDVGHGVVACAEAVAGEAEGEGDGCELGGLDGGL